MTTAATAWIGEPHKATNPQWGRPAGAVEPAAPVRPVVNDVAVLTLVGRNLRRLRKQHRLSLEELARQSGVSRAMLGQIEQGKSIPSIKTLWQVAQALSVSVSWFLEPGSDAQVLLMAPAPDSATTLRAGEGELRSLQHAGDSLRDAFYELRLAAGAELSLPAATSSRRINVAVSAGVLDVHVDNTVHLVHAREVLQYESADALVWRNAGHLEAQAYVVIRSVSKP